MCNLINPKEVTLKRTKIVYKAIRIWCDEKETTPCRASILSNRINYSNSLKSKSFLTNNNGGFYCSFSKKAILKWIKFIGGNLTILEYFIPKKTTIKIGKIEDCRGVFVLTPILLNPRIKEYSDKGIDEFISNKETIKREEYA